MMMMIAYSAALAVLVAQHPRVRVLGLEVTEVESAVQATYYRLPGNMLMMMIQARNPIAELQQLLPQLVEPAPERFCDCTQRSSGAAVRMQCTV
jgi:hypothetical protein